MSIVNPTVFNNDLCTGWTFANKDNIKTLFGEKSHEYVEFLKFLELGSQGVVLVINNEWASYAFMSIPGKSGPPHLPGWIKQKKCYWIYNCHTKEKFRGKGYYKQALLLLTGFARNQVNEAPIYIDTAEDNIASRRAIIATGFQSMGKLICYNLWVPYRCSVTLHGKWKYDCVHDNKAGLLL